MHVGLDGSVFVCRLMLWIGFFFSRRQESLGDYYLGGRKMNKELIVVSRLAVGVVSLVAITMAMNTTSDFFKVVMDMVSFAWGGFGAAFGPLVLLALFWKRTNLAGAVSGMVVGATTCFFWKFSAFADAARAASPDPIFHLYELAPGFLFAFVVTVVVSLLTGKPSAEMLDEFECVLKRSERK